MSVLQKNIFSSKKDYLVAKEDVIKSGGLSFLFYTSDKIMWTVF